MRKRATLTRPYDGLLTAFFVPVVIMIIIFIQRGIFPFGEESFLRTDMYHQYAPFFSEFQHKLRTGGSLLYSWDVGLGVNFAALYAYYLASPLNWLIILCPKAFIIEFMTGMVVLKIGLSGLSFAYYLKKKLRVNTVGIGFFGIFYALSGYMAAYSWNIMWLDCILLLPLIVLGLERLVKKERGFLYCVTLGLSILSNYYISIMTCLFMVLYFAALLLMERPHKPDFYFKAASRFGLYSLLAGGLAAAVLLPEIYALASTASGDFSFPKSLTSYFSIFDMLARHIGNVETEIGLDHWPNLYCGVAVLLFFPLYLACKRIPVREKAVYCGLLLIFYASFSVNALNFIWHGFHYPNSLPCRQSFIYIFLMLYMCFRAFQYLRQTQKKHVAIALWGSVSFVVLAEKLVEQEHFHFSVFYVAIVFLSAYAGVIYLYKRRKQTVAAFLALSLVAIEAAVNMTVTSVTTTSREAYTRDNADVCRLMETLEPAGEFYRVEKKTRKTKNDGAWMNFPSVSLFSSTANADLTKFFKRLGCEASTNAYSITGSTPLVDSLLSVKYALYTDTGPNTEITMYLRESGSTYLYENLYTLPLGFAVPEAFEESWQYEMDNPAEVQNDLCLIAGAEDVLIPANGETSGNTFRFTTDMTGEYYVYVLNKRAKTVKASLPTGAKTFNNVERGFLLELGTLAEGNEILLTAEESGETLNAIAYRFSESGLVSFYEALSQSPLSLTSWKDTKLEGRIEAKEAGRLFLSIPYDKGWTVRIDGEPVETKKLFDAFLSVELAEGSHTVELSYFPQGLSWGLCLTAGSALALAALWFFIRKREKRQEIWTYRNRLDEAVTEEITKGEDTL
ncbi:MAG: YfhO family protein [Lachnospiraceae bacterium]|nr:YfhO family protein [Lachnospiraceae bacterium]